MDVIYCMLSSETQSVETDSVYQRVEKQATEQVPIA